MDWHYAPESRAMDAVPAPRPRPVARRVLLLGAVAALAVLVPALLLGGGRAEANGARIVNGALERSNVDVTAVMTR